MCEASSPTWSHDKWITLPIELPQRVRGYALDIGGSLAKLAYIEHDAVNYQTDKGTRIRMVTFKPNKLEEILEFIHDKALLGKDSDDDVIGFGSGIGVVASQERIKEKLGDSFKLGNDEFTCMSKALHYGLFNIPRDDFVLMPHGEPDWLEEARRETDILSGYKDKLFPALMNCVGSASSVQLVSEDGSARLVGGSVRGGLYTMSVGKLLTQCKDFDELLELAKKGNPTNLTVTLQEVLQNKYGAMNCEDLEQKYPFVIDLFPFGKVIHQGIESPSREDIAATWLRTCHHDFLDMALLHAHVYDKDIAYFCGSAVTDNEMFNEKSIQMVFHNKFFQMDHKTVYPAIIKIGRYMTALGALLCGIEEWIEKNKNI